MKDRVHLRPPHACSAQRGLVVLGFVVVVATIGSFLFIKSINRGQAAIATEVAAIVADNQALLQAKEALLNYAIAYPDLQNPAFGPGRFPCPDLNNDGSSEGSCDSDGPNYTVGRLPYSNLPGGIRYVDDSGETLWYAVAESHRAQLLTINSDTGSALDDLDVDGEGDVVAIVISAGPALAGQDRGEAHRNLISAYLEGDNASLGDDSFNSTRTEAKNDRLVTITREELNRAIEKRVAQTVRDGFARYALDNGALPYLASFIATSASGYNESFACVGKVPVTSHPGYFPTWFENEWIDQVLVVYGDLAADYGVVTCTLDIIANLQQTNGQITTLNNVRSMILVAGRRLPGLGQVRTTPFMIADYFEGENNDADWEFDGRISTASANDVTLIWDAP